MARAIDCKAVLFDFDGTLFNSYLGVYATFVEAYQHFYPHGDISHIEPLKTTCYKNEVAFPLVFKKAMAEITEVLFLTPTTALLSEMACHCVWE